MFILGIQGSPRKNGNSQWLLASFLKECETYGATTKTIDSCKSNILPCRELLVCEKKGNCPLKDDMEKTIYALIRKADIVVLASPVFFYNVTAQAKTLIDRCQMFWGRKYKLRLKDPHSYHRQGFLLSVAASGGEKLFDGLHLTARYFFDAISADYQGALTYKHIEDAQQIQSHPGVKKDIKNAVKDLVTPFLEKKTLLFMSEHDVCRGQIAGAFARIQAKGKLNVITAGYDAHARVLPEIIRLMAKKGLDLEYQSPRQIETVRFLRKPDIVVNLDSGKEQLEIPAMAYQDWNIKRPLDISAESLKSLADEIESRVMTLISAVC